MTLVELLIAMVVMAIGISALVAGFSSGVFAVKRGAQTSIAGTLADKQMEVYRQQTFASLTPGVQSASTSSGSDGATYWTQATISWTCVVGPANTTTSSTAPTCTGGAASRPVKLVSIDVKDGSSSGKLLFNEASTFDASTG